MDGGNAFIELRDRLLREGVSHQQAVDYRLSAVGRGRTRLQLLSTERWLTPDFPTREALRAQIAATWARFAAAIEADYRAGRPARGK